MTTPSLDPPSTTAQNIPQAAAPASQIEPGHNTLSSSAVEMTNLPSSTGAPATTNTTTSDSGAPQLAPVEFTNVGEISAAESTQPSSRNELNRTETEAALGPSTDGPAANPDNTNGPTLVIMLLLTTGARHPYKIDERYLKKRNVTVEGMDPYNISVYTLKELIWRDWRDGTSGTPCISLLSLLSIAISNYRMSYPSFVNGSSQSRYRLRNGTRSDDISILVILPYWVHEYLYTATPASPAFRAALLT